MSRYLRQQDLIDLNKLQETTVAVIGVGAIGRQVALQLAAMGVKHLTLIDFDTVDEHNLPNQGFRENQLGCYKVEATAEDCKALNKDIELTIINAAYTPRKHQNCADVVFSCVDSIPVRKAIFEHNNFKLFIDGRMSAEEMRILTINTPIDRHNYESSLQGPFLEAPCTAKSTIYCANVAAGIMVQQFTKWLREFPLENDIRFSLFSNTLFIGPPQTI